MRTRALLLAAMFAVAMPRSSPQGVDPAFAAFWAAAGPAEAAVAAQPILRTGAGFDDVYAKLAAGPPPAAGAATGRLVLERENADGTPHPYLVMVPDDYDPTRRYPVRVYLHGGVNRPSRGGDGSWWRDPQRVAGADHIAVFPLAWSESLWWQASQVENLAGILWSLKRGYNIDDNRVYLFGVSDGGTGAWFFAFRATTPWAAFLPFISHPAVLSNPRTGVDGELFPVNLSGKPFYVVNGGRDRLYPATSVEPYMRLFRDAGVDLTFVAKPESGHGTGWWPDEAAAIDAFIDSHPRDPLPDRIAWRTDSVGRSNRAHWVVIDAIVADDRPLREPNAVTVEGSSYLAFPRRGISGQIDAVRDGNEVDVDTWGVGRYTLLLSPAEFDFDEPVVVRTNGSESFRGRIEPSPAVLLKWAARDGDRTMLFGAELTVDVEPR